MEKYLSLKEAAAVLGMNPKRVRAVLEAAFITIHADIGDQRRSIVRAEDVLRLRDRLDVGVTP